MTKRECKVCNKEFWIYPAWLKKDKRAGLYCSVKCRIEGVKRKIKIKCQICNKEFLTVPSRFKIGLGKFCSKKCYGKSMLGIKNHQWKGGYSKAYQLQQGQRRWNKIARKVHARDNYICQICGKRNVKIDAHHIIPWRISRDDSLKNLISLCRPCHMKIERKWDKFK